MAERSHATAAFAQGIQQGKAEDAGEGPHPELAHFTVGLGQVVGIKGAGGMCLHSNSGFQRKYTFFGVAIKV